MTKNHTKTDNLLTVAAAARALLDRLENITTHDFERGGEKAEREALHAALAELDA